MDYLLASKTGARRINIFTTRGPLGLLNKFPIKIRTKPPLFKDLYDEFYFPSAWVGS